MMVDVVLDNDEGWHQVRNQLINVASRRRSLSRERQPTDSSCAPRTAAADSSVAARGALAEDSVTAITTGGRSKVGQSSRGVQSAKPSIVSDARLQTTNIFLLLCVYPMICRKTFAVFDCVEAGVDERTGESLFFLREDPVE
ncbi:MAG: hypothetical protein ACPIOQ_61100, partial [Promethearchaeia archaeon]